MCGRFILHAQPKALVDLFALDDLPPELPPRFNVAPSQKVAVVAQGLNGKRGLRSIQWGLIQNWADSTAGKFRPPSARAETVAHRRGRKIRRPGMGCQDVKIT